MSLAGLKHSALSGLRSIGLLLVILPFTTVAEVDDKKAHTAELKELRSRIQTLSSSLQEERDQADSFSKDLREVENSIGRTAFKLRILTNSLKRQQLQLVQLRNREQQQTETLDKHRNLLSRQVRTAYTMGRQERIKIMLNQEDPALLSRMLEYHNYLTKERVRRISLIRDILQQLKLTRDTIATEESRLVELRDKAVARKQELEQTKQERQQVLKQLQRQITDHDNELASLKRNVLDLEKLISGLKDALADIPADLGNRKSFAARKGKFRWPTKGRLLAKFGSQRDADVNWDGVYIGAKEGRNVKAIAYGRVAFADWLRGFGLLIIIDHGNGYMSLYGHNQSLFKEVGEWVEAGEQIASVGFSGGQKKSGIYFGLRRNGKPLNPASWCKRPRGKRVGVRTDDVSIHQYSAKVSEIYPSWAGRNSS